MAPQDVPCDARVADLNVATLQTRRLGWKPLLTISGLASIMSISLGIVWGDSAAGRNALPGWLVNDVDWAENFTIVKARMLQSEYWAQIQSSLLIGIVRWLDNRPSD